MQQFLEKLNFYADVSSRIVNGDKINPRDYSPILIQDLKSVAARIYTGFFSPLEPQSLVIEEGWGSDEIAQMGLTTSHPLMGALVKEGQAIANNHPNALVFGSQATGRDLKAPKTTGASILTKGDFVALAQAITEIQYRLNHKKSGPFAPLIIQDRRFWGSLFINEPSVVQDLKKSGIYVVGRPEDAHDILATAKQDPKSSHRSAYKVTKPDNIFASTDQIKTGHNTVAQSSYEGEFSVAHTVLGPSRIPVEETKSYAGNALVKMVALMRLSLERLQGKETDNSLLSVHDGGVAFFLMNDKGERYTELFTDPEFFPFSAEFMNKILAGPGVELAELYKSSPNFKTVMDALYAKVEDVCKKDKRFKPTDLMGVDTAIQMAIPAKEFFKIYEVSKARHPDLNDDQICEQIALRHAVTVGDMQKVKLLKEPQYNSEPLSIDTEHYIEAEGHVGKSRAQVPEWMTAGPNAVSYHMLMNAVGAKRIGGEGQQAYWREGKINLKVAVPGMLSGLSGKNSHNLSSLKSELGEHGIKFRMGTDYWSHFRDSNGSNGAALDFNHAADTHRQNIRKILAAHDFLYIPKDCTPPTQKAKEEYLLLISSAMVQRQVFKRNAPFIVMEKGPLADDVIEIFKSLKNGGLIGQRFEHLVYLTDGPKQSADVINSISRMKRPTVRHTPKMEQAIKLDEPENYTATIYCSASNKNAVWKADVEAYSTFLALQGIDLKLGGGNDGMMKASADGYMKGLAEIVKRGETPKGKLHLIQCDDTVTIEGDYEIPAQFKQLDAYIDRRCYATIEERRYDLQRSHMSVGGPGGLGTFEEIDCELLAEKNGEKELDLYLLSQSFAQPDGQIGYVYDYLPKVLQLNHKDVHISHTVGELEVVTRNNLVSFEARQREREAALAVLRTQLAQSQFSTLKIA